MIMEVLPNALVLILCFLFVTFLISAFEKVSDWSSSKKYYTKVYKDSLPIFLIAPILIFIFLTEVVLVSILGFGIYDILYKRNLIYVHYALVGSGVLFTLLLIGLRIIKDYNGASRLGVYFLITILGLALLSINLMGFEK